MSREADARRTAGADHEAPADRDRMLGVGGFVAVHLLALLVVGEPSLPALVPVEAIALVALVAGDAVTTGVGLRRTLPAAAGVLAALVAVGVALGPAGAEPWVVAAAAFAVAGSLLYAGHRYDRYLGGGGA